MTVFFRLLEDGNKEVALANSVESYKKGDKDKSTFKVDYKDFFSVPRSPFAYWVSEDIRKSFTSLELFESGKRTVKQGLATADDFRFIRLWWEINNKGDDKWAPFAKGGDHSRYYADIHLVVKWENSGDEIKNFRNIKTGKLNSRPQNLGYYLKPGFTYTSYTNLGFGPRVLPSGCIFSIAGMGIFGAEDYLLALLNSSTVQGYLNLIADFRKWEAGVIQRIPLPDTPALIKDRLTFLAKRAWYLKRQIDIVDETSHSFILPEILLIKTSGFNRESILKDLNEVEVEIDIIAHDLYNISESDRDSMLSITNSEEDDDNDDIGTTEGVTDKGLLDSLFSWSVGVAFGRYDSRLVGNKIKSDSEPDIYAKLPDLSPGMLSDKGEPFHFNNGILADDPGHPSDVTRLVEEVLDRVEITPSDDLRKWLQKDFFDYHLKQYSKSRRKAPIYWPLSTSAGSYTIWVYYPKLSSQSLYIAINDFLEPKLKEVTSEIESLKTKGSQRSKAEDKAYEKLQALEDELIEMRDEVLEIAKNYHPNHDDGVQISAAPLWPLFRQKAWQKVLKDTWKKLEKGDYDWTHLAMSYWPERVREKCKKDKSLAIAHDLEDL